MLITRGTFLIPNKDDDTLTCPAGQTLSFSQQRGSVKSYRGKAKVCNACELKSQCTTSRQGRSIYWHENQKQFEEAKKQSTSRQARSDRVRRKWLAEGSFADAANNHGFKRARWRRMWRQRIQDFMIAAVQNLRKLIKHSRRTLPIAAVSRQIDQTTGLYRLICQLFLTQRVTTSIAVSSLFNL